MKNKNSGFTLVELMIVICMIGILVAAATPSFGRYRINSITKDAAQDIYNILQLAKINAIRTGKPVNVEFDNAASDAIQFSTVVMRVLDKDNLSKIKMQLSIDNRLRTSLITPLTIFNSRGRVSSGVGTWVINNDKTGYGYRVVVNTIGNITINPFSGS